MKQLILNALRESVEAHPELIPLLTGKAAAHVKLMAVNRAALERKLERLIRANQRGELEKLLSYLGNPPDINNVPDVYWQNGWRSLQADIEPVLIQTYVEQAEALMGTLPIGVDWAVINTTAARWASQYSFELVRGISEVTRRGLQEVVPRFYTDGMNLGQLKEALGRWFESPVRAQMIAVTETTRAAVEGERALIEQLQRESGIKMQPIWQTANDEAARKCPECSPRHGKPITDNLFPPAHPNCRCWVTYDWVN